MFASSTNLNQRKWLETPVTNQGKMKKQRSSARLKWPIFGEMAKVEPDLFWQEYWVMASKGKFPAGFSFNGKELFYSYRNKRSKVVFDDNVIDMCQLAKHMYQDNSNLYSPLDMKHISQRRELMNSDRIARASTSKIASWSDCNASQRNNLVTYYLLELASEYNLSGRGKNELEQTLWVGINIGAFNEKKIQMENNKIVSITGLKWDPDCKRFRIDLDKAPFKIKKPSKAMSKNVDGYCLYSHWLKLNNPKTSSKDKVIEIGIDDIDDSISTSYYKDG